MENCRNCNSELNGKFCGSCGQPAQLKRIDGHFVRHEIEHVLHLEKGIFFTIRELFIRPGIAVKTFISENRNRLVKPIIFLIVCSLIYSLVSHSFHAEKIESPEMKSMPALILVLDWIDHHYGYANLIMGIFITMWLRLFFRKTGYNFFEILILLCYVMGIGMLLYAVQVLIEKLGHLHLGQLANIPVFIYTIWAMGQFFAPKKISSYLKSLAAYALGMLVFYILITVLVVVMILLGR